MCTTCVWLIWVAGPWFGDCHAVWLMFVARQVVAGECSRGPAFVELPCCNPLIPLGASRSWRHRLVGPMHVPMSWLRHAYKPQQKKGALRRSSHPAAAFVRPLSVVRYQFSHRTRTRSGTLDPFRHTKATDRVWVPNIMLILIPWVDEIVTIWHRHPLHRCGMLLVDSGISCAQNRTLRHDSANQVPRVSNR